MAKFFIITGTSAAGKTSVMNGLLKKDRALTRSITYTTRPKRVGEKSGLAYHFISLKEFKQKKQRHEFLETANNYGNWYGTNKKDISSFLRLGKNIITVTDIKGARSIKRIWPKKSVTFFIAPENLNQLKIRFKERHDTSLAQEKKRLETAKLELAQARFCDLLIINQQNKLKKTIKDVWNIIKEETKKKP